MGEFCPNINVKSVREGFNEMVEAFGGSPLTVEEFKNPELRNKRTGIDNMAMQKAYYLYNKNKGNSIDNNTDGVSSELFNSLVASFGSRNRAIVAKSVIYTDSFINNYGTPDVTDNEMFSSLVADTNIIGTDTSMEISSILGIDNKSSLNNHISKGTVVTTSDNVMVNLLSSGLIPKELLPAARLLVNTGVPIKVIPATTKTHVANTRNGEVEITTVGINTDINTFVSALLHELVHITTVNTIKNPKTKSDKEFVSMVKSAFRKTLSKSYNNNKYAFTDIREFVAEFMSNPTFRKSLKQEGVFSRVINAILRLFKARSINNDMFTSQDELNLENAIKTVINDNITIGNYYHGVLYLNTTPNLQIDPLGKLLRSIKDGLKSRLSAVKRYKVPPQVTIDSITNILDVVENLDTIAAVQEFVNSHLTSISGIANELVNKPIESIKTKQLMQLKNDYVGFYLPIIKQIKYIIDTSDDLAEMNDYDTFTSNVNALYNEMEFLDNRVRNILVRKSRDFIINYTNKYGGDALEILDYLDNCDDDITWLSTYIGMNSAVDNDIIRIMENIVHNVKNNVARTTLKKGNKLKKLLQAAQKKHGNSITNLFQEKDKEGKTTGYFTRNRKYGEFYRDKKEFIQKLADRYNLEVDEVGNIKFPDYDSPIYSKFYNDYEDWIGNHAERRYKKEYYKLRNTLTPYTREAMDNIRMDINTITSRVLNEDGIPELHKLSQDDRAALNSLNAQYENLGSTFFTNGVAKSGKELEIALDIQRYRKLISGKLKYEVNKAAFDRAESNIIKQYGKNSLEHRAWYLLNTEIAIDDKFWDEIGGSLPKTERQIELDAAKKALLSQFKSKDTLGYNSESASSEVILAIKAIDELIEQEKQKGDATFFDYASIENTAQYEKEKALAKEEAKILGVDIRETQWYKDNHYLGTQGTYRPISIHTYVKPKNAKYIIRKPIRIWSELDKSSEFANNKFIENGESIQPNARLYDNSGEYKKITSDPVLKALYDELIKTMEESVEKISFLRNSDANKLPQISGRMMSILYRATNKKDALKYLFDDTFSIKDDDVDFVEKFNSRPDGTKIKNIPTRFIALLDDPSKITSDVVGSVVRFFEMTENYEQMSEQAPELEMLAARLGDLEVKKNGVLLKNKGQLNAYKKAIKLLDMHVYGAKRDQLLVKGKNITKFVDMVYNWTSKSNLWFNINSMATNLFSGAIYKFEEALLGRYFNTHDLAFAEIEFDKLFVKNVTSLGSKYRMNKLMALLQLNQLTISNDDVFDKLDQSAVIRAISKHWSWNGYSAGDFIVKSKIMLSVYHSYRLVQNSDGTKAFMTEQQFVDRNYPTDRKKGKTAFNTFKTTLYDAYNLDGLNATPNAQFSKYISNDLLNAVQNKASTIATRIDGALSETDKTFIHANAFSRFLVQCKNFMIVGIQERVKPKQFNYNTGSVEAGFFTTTGGHLADQFGVLYNVITGYFGNDKMASLKMLVDNYNNLKDYEKYAVKRVVMDLLFIVISSLLTSMLCSYVDGDDENKNNWLMQELSYVSLRTAFELRTLYNPFELTGLMNSPSAAFNVITNASDVLKLLWIPSYFGEKGPFTPISSGRYEGMPRIGKTIIRSTWGRNIYEAPDPKTIKNKRNYLENQLMW